MESRTVANQPVSIPDFLSGGAGPPLGAGKKRELRPQVKPKRYTGRNGITYRVKRDEEVKLLLVEDDPRLRNSLKTALMRSGHTVVPAADGEEALSIYKELSRSMQPIEFILTDYQTPHLNGLELIQRIRARDAEIPALLITAFGNEDLKKECESLGKCAYLEKPATIATIIAAIKSVSISIS